MENLLNLIVEEALVMIPVLLFLGWVIKRTESIVDNWIPLILWIIGTAFTPLLLGGFTSENIVQGTLVTAGAVFANQLYKQANEIQEEPNKGVDK